MLLWLDYYYPQTKSCYGRGIHWPSLSDLFGCLELLPGQSSVVLLTLTSMKKVSYTVGMSFQTWQKMKSQTMHSEMRANRSSLVVSESPLKRNLGLLNEQKNIVLAENVWEFQNIPSSPRMARYFIMTLDFYFIENHLPFQMKNSRFRSKETNLIMTPYVSIEPEGTNLSTLRHVTGHFQWKGIWLSVVIYWTCIRRLCNLEISLLVAWEFVSAHIFGNGLWKTDVKHQGGGGGARRQWPDFSMSADTHHWTQ